MFHDAGPITQLNQFSKDLGHMLCLAYIIATRLTCEYDIITSLLANFFYCKNLKIGRHLVKL